MEYNISRKEVRERIPAALGEIIGMVQRGLNSSMLMTGGDTLLGCMHHLGDTELTPVGEYEIGIVLSQLVSNNNKTHVFTKSGGFGEETLLTDMAAKICRTDVEGGKNTMKYVMTEAVVQEGMALLDQKCRLCCP